MEKIEPVIFSSTTSDIYRFFPCYFGYINLNQGSCSEGRKCYEGQTRTPGICSMYNYVIQFFLNEQFSCIAYINENTFKNKI